MEDHEPLGSLLWDALRKDHLAEIDPVRTLTKKEKPSRERRSWRAMEAEPHFYRGHWHAAVQAAEEALPVAWEIREWAVILWSSAWLAIAHLKLAQPAASQQVLSRAFDEVPARALGYHAYAIPYAHVALAQLHLAMGNTEDAMTSARRACEASQGSRFRLEAGAAYRVLGEVHEACGCAVTPTPHFDAA